MADEELNMNLYTAIKGLYLLLKPLHENTNRDMNDGGCWEKKTCQVVIDT